MKIEVLGTGCAKCNKLFDAVQQAVAKAGVDAQVVKVEDLMEIMKRGATVTPALVVDGVIKVAGKMPKVEALVKLLG